MSAVQALKHAERGIYSGRSLGSVTPAQLSSHLPPSKAAVRSSRV